jgi:signal transduction histidine kinase
LELLGPVAFNKKVTLRLKNASNLPKVTLDAQKIGQVLGNILSNAIKFTPRGGSIEVSAGLPNDHNIRLEVRDTGIGIPPEHLDTVFEKFGKHQRKGTEGERGTGLGMPIVKRFVELHNGTVAIDSVVDKGTTITVELPVM